MKHALVELVDGQIVTRDAEQWRSECLARHVLQLPSRPARQEWLADFEKKHGSADTERLRETMTALHQKARAA
jgi:hypothetical protein